MLYRAVFFDLGGVVIGSPLHAIAAYEGDHDIPAGSVNRVVVNTAPSGAWSQLERGALTLEEFYPAFDADCAAAGVAISARALMQRVVQAIAPRPAMLDAIRRIRERGVLAGAITNNWVAEDGGTSVLRPHFDGFVESAVVGIRKPDPRIFRLACEQLGVAPHEAVFLDDIGINLKAARALGMTTIKVEHPDSALAELQSVLGFPLG
jgi:epoxide hydrolase-like predicted phosphatase